MAPVLEYNLVRKQSLIFVLFLSFKALSCQTAVISPYPTASVTEDEPLEMTCTFFEQIQRLKWSRDEVKALVTIDKNCTEFGSSKSLDKNRYNFSCVSNTIFTLTILKASRHDHGQRWSCDVFGINSSDWHPSNNMSIFVIVPVRSVSINITESSVMVEENQPVAFKCTTSVERPRSTIQWFVKNGNSPLPGDFILPTDNDTLSPTESIIKLTFSKGDSNDELYCTAINTNTGTPANSGRKVILVKYAPTKGPIIVGYSDGDHYSLIVSEPQSLVCYVVGGYPDPTVKWDCYSGLTTDISGEGEVRKQVNWTTDITTNGTCKCIADQEVSGPKWVELDIIVLYPPTNPWFYANRTHNVNGTLKEIIGRTVDVTCVTYSLPKPFSYAWFGPETADSDTLRLLNVEIDMQGIYKCQAMNEMKPTIGAPKNVTVRSQFTLKVLYPPDKPSLHFRSNLLNDTLSVIEGDSVTIECKSSGEPNILAYSWIGSAEEKRSSLVFKNIRAVDRGTYVCNVSNSMSPTIGPDITGFAESSVMINVMSTPTIPNILYSSSNKNNKPLFNHQLAVIEGSTFSLKCTGSAGNPNPIHSWQAVETAVQDIVHIANISSADKKKYTCLATNMMNTTFGKPVKGQNMTAVDIEVLYPPRFDRIGTQYITENKNLSLPCVADSNPLPFLYVWTRSYDAVKQTSQVLTIENIKRSETGLYTCNANNWMNTTLEGRAVGTGSITVEVRVFYHPGINISQLNGTDIVEGTHSVILLCTANADPTNYTFTKWTHFAPDGSTVIQQYDAIEDMKGQISLKFQSVKIIDSGIYECSVTNGISDYQTGNVYASINTTQVIKGRPVVTKSHSDITAELHTNITLAVSYYSNDGTDPTVQWYRIQNDTKQEINKNDTRVFYENEADTVNVTYYSVTVVQQGNTSYLHIMDINGEDFVLYEAIISNSINTTVSSIWLRAQGAPETPTELKIVPNSVTPSAVTVTWISGFHGGADQTFHVQYNTSTVMWQDGAEVEGFQQQNRQFRATIDNLSSNTKYFFRIYAENIHGSSTITTEIVSAYTGSDTIDKAASPNVGLIAGGAAGAVALAAIIFALVLMFLRRRQKYLESPSKSLLKDNERKPCANGADDTSEINLNPMYESAGPLPSTSNVSDVYSQVDKNRKKENTVGDIYSQVDKPKKRQNPGGSEVKNDVYAKVEKQAHKEKDAGKTKQKKQKPDKKTKKGKQTAGDIYDNVDTLNSTVTKGDTVYENPSCGIEDERPIQMRNQDGLIYADLDLPEDDVWKGKKAVIHGLEDRTDYADITYGVVGEQAQDSDEENTKKE